MLRVLPFPVCALLNLIWPQENVKSPPKLFHNSPYGHTPMQKNVPLVSLPKFPFVSFLLRFLLR